jgi:hypothetical protein
MSFPALLPPDFVLAHWRLVGEEEDLQKAPRSQSLEKPSHLFVIVENFK